MTGFEGKDWNGIDVRVIIDYFMSKKGAAVATEVPRFGRVKSNLKVWYMVMDESLNFYLFTFHIF